MRNGIFKTTLEESASRIGMLCLVVALAASLGCGGDSNAPLNRARYKKIERETIEFYSILHPLRSSRIGIERSDSALFTFSKEELSQSHSTISRILDDMSGLTTEGLDRRDIFNSQLILGWLRGEEFALKKLRLYEINPMLYCWIINEALWGIPSRQYPPGDEELDNYRTRLEKLPALIENARLLCEKPSQLHIRLSLEMLNRLLENKDALRDLLRNRYERETAWLDPVIAEIGEFREFIRYDLSNRAYGRVILGSENLSKIFEYDEHIVDNPNELILKAEKKIQRLLISRKTIIQRIERQRNEAQRTGETKNFYSKLEPEVAKIAQTLIGEMLRGVVSFGPLKGAPEVIITANPGRFNYFRESNYLSFPYHVNLTLEWIPSSLKPSLKKRGFIMVHGCSMDRCFPDVGGLGSLKADSLSIMKFRLLKSLSMKESCTESFPVSDTLRTILCSETYKHGCLSEILDNELRRYSGSEDIRLHAINDEIFDLAMMIAVFRLHGGNYSMESATDFFMDTLGLERDHALDHVRAALVSAETAYPGLSRLIIEDIRNKLHKSKDLELRNRSVLDLMKSNPALPLSFIEDIYFD